MSDETKQLFIFCISMCFLLACLKGCVETDIKYNHEYRLEKLKEHDHDPQERT